VTIRVSDREVSERFYDMVLAAVGLDSYTWSSSCRRGSWWTSSGGSAPRRAFATTAHPQRFYQTVAPHTGFSLRSERPDRRTFAGGGGEGSFTLVSGTPTENLHLAFSASANPTVDAFHRAAMEAGYRDNGQPGERAAYHPGYYGAFVLDPDS
jgi:catechol 2,3-dioxygenase-like lactoylglutathione lyase family enzyme